MPDPVSPDTFLDTNVILRHILDDHADHSSRAHAFFARVERGDESVRTSETVIFECVFTLERLYRIPRSAIGEALLLLLSLPGIVLPGKTHLRRVFDLYVAHPRISFADCYHAVLAKRLGLSRVLSFDRDFDRLPDFSPPRTLTLASRARTRCARAIRQANRPHRGGSADVHAGRLPCSINSAICCTRCIVMPCRCSMAGG
jgi:predicted nucleic acid-binding protein